MPGTTPNTEESRQQYHWDHLSAERQKALIEVADNMIAGKKLWKWLIVLGGLVTGVAVLLAAIAQMTGTPVMRWPR